ncbi:MAG: T9SS type A sorting domain-containing protein [Crocinitomicaceae bacterium]|nr:T9SS type A sorting domain-containing protein [Crocinitomicaceae bacterium]
MKILVSITCIILSAFLAHSQTPSILWQNYFGGDSDDILRRVESPSGGYYFIGHSSSNISGDKTEISRGFSDIWIIKTDVSYNIEWDKTIGGDYYDDVSDIIILNDTIYVLTQSGSGISGEKTIAPFGAFGYTDLWLVTLDLDGNILWQQQYGGESDESSAQMTPLANGNILIASLSNSDISGNKTEAQIGLDDFWLVEISPQDGNIINQKVIGSSQIETLSNVIQLSSGEIIIKGGSYQGISGDKTDAGYGAEDIWIVKLDQNYSVIADKCFGGDNVDSGSDGQVIEHSGFLYLSCSSQSDVSGNKTSPNYGGKDYWILKIDLNLNLIWDKSYGGTNDDLIGTIDYYDFNKLVISGASISNLSGNKTSPNYGSYDAWLLIVNLDGDLIAQESYGGADVDAGIAQKEFDGTKILLTNYSTSAATGLKTVPSHGGYDCWFLELDASSFLNTDELAESGAKLSVYPNPVNDNVNFKFTDLNEAVMINFYTTDGRLIYSRNVEKNTAIVNIGFNFANQVIIYEVIGESFKSGGKLILN